MYENAVKHGNLQHYYLISASKTQFGSSTLLCGTWELIWTDSATKDVEDEHSAKLKQELSMMTLHLSYPRIKTATVNGYKNDGICLHQCNIITDQ